MESVALDGAAAESDGAGDGRYVVELKLTDPEAKILRDTLESDLSDLLREIARTERREMREGLKTKEELLRGILARIGDEMRQAS